MRKIIKRVRKRKELKWTMIRMLLMCWFLPLISLIFIMTFLVSNNTDKQIENIVVMSADKAVEICQLRLQDSVTASQNSSYISTIKDSYNRFILNEDELQLSNTVSPFLEQQYKYNDNFKAAILYFVENTKPYYTYNNATDASYQNVIDFNNHALETVMEMSSKIDTSTVFTNINNRIYMVRNIMDSKFKPIAVITMELNEEEIFESLKSVFGVKNYEVYIDGEPLLRSDINTDSRDIALEKPTKKSVFMHGKSEYIVYKQVKFNTSRITYLVELDSKTILSQRGTTQYIFYLLLLFMLPLIILVMYFFHRRVTKPVKHLVEAAHSIEQGHYGEQIVQLSDNQEFYYLDEAFNSMSTQLQYQFEKIYLEEIALRDANIMALQSQINPHFLNNTLEIINWEARLLGNYKVSNMIEALSTMLEATMNRSGRKLISLEEELSHVDAYLYIVAQRFGDRFEAVKDIDESLLKVEVPRLIIQPIIENAVEHGMDTHAKGKISINIYRNEDKLTIEVIDNGMLTDKEREKIDKLLNDDCDKSKERSTSLGIRNVNKRLKIIYGDDCGLSITSNKEMHTVSTILVRMESKDDTDLLN